MPSKNTRSARARSSLPSTESKSRSPAIPGASQPRRSRPLRQWRTSGVTNKQSTLTQIDFVRPLGRYNSEDDDLEYEEEGLGQDFVSRDDIPEEPRRKRRKIDVLKDSNPSRRKSMPATTNLRIDDEKENHVQQTVDNDDTVDVKPKFQTPRKGYNREVYSSQSPVTPLSVRSTRFSIARTEISPLKDLSTNIPRQPRLIAEDTYKTNDTTGSSLSRVASVNSDVAASRSPRSTSGERIKRDIHVPAELIPKFEILDSDEEISDTGTIRSLRSSRYSVRHEKLAQQQSNSIPDTALTTRSVGSEADIYRPPVSDDSKDEIQERTLDGGHIDQETNTLDDRLLLKRMRTYSGSRRRSVMATIPSSSIGLEELPLDDLASPQSITTPTRHVNEVPSSPPVYLTNKQPKNNELHSDETNADPCQVQIRSSSSSESDSQKATAQLQQESQWQAPRIPSSQATTASVSLSSSPSREGKNRKQASSGRQGWLFHPLTDSQLLPDSVMNFELPRFPRMLGGRRHDDIGSEVAEDQ